MSISDVLPFANNPKLHPDDQVDKMASSTKNYSFLVPLVVDSGGEVVAGHLTQAQVKAFRLADNQLSMATGWDPELLTAELEALLEDGVDLKGLGFTEEDLRGYLAALKDITPQSPVLEPREPEADRYIEIYCSNEAFTGIEKALEEWSRRDGITVNIT